MRTSISLISSILGAIAGSSIAWSLSVPHRIDGDAGFVAGMSIGLLAILFVSCYISDDK